MKRGVPLEQISGRRGAPVVDPRIGEPLTEDFKEGMRTVRWHKEASSTDRGRHPRQPDPLRLSPPGLRRYSSPKMEMGHTRRLPASTEWRGLIDELLAKKT